jgi:hypothetical protein
MWIIGTLCEVLYLQKMDCMNEKGNNFAKTLRSSCDDRFIQFDSSSPSRNGTAKVKILCSTETMCGNLVTLRNCLLGVKVLNVCTLDSQLK